MNKKELLLKMLPGLLPLFVFIVADEIWGTKIGMYVAVAFGLSEFIFTFFKTKRVDLFILLDILLLVIMGGISLILENDVFFKLKPAIIEAILCLIIGISAFSPTNIVENMSKRYMNGIDVDDAVRIQMTRSMRNLFWIFLGHIFLVVFSALKLSTAVWGFISGGLFYILVGLYFVYEWLHRYFESRKIKFSDEEWVPIVNEEEKIIGKAARSQVHNGSKLLHPVIHLHIINSKGEIFLQKRPMSKLIQPGKWDTAVGGHVSFGEDIAKSLQREAIEEVGLDISKVAPTLVQRYRWDTDIESELVYLFIVKTDIELQLNAEELDGGKYWSKKEIQKALNKDLLTPNFELEFRLIDRFI